MSLLPVAGGLSVAALVVLVVLFIDLFAACAYIDLVMLIIFVFTGKLTWL